MENKKLSLGIIITLLIIFLPITAYSTFMHFLNNPISNKKEFKKDGKLNFYNKENNLIGTYTCEYFDDYCDYAISSSNYSYSLEEYEFDSKTKTTLINDRYAFITDTPLSNLKSAEVLLVDVYNNKVIAHYKEMKNYGIGIDENIYLVKSEEDLWGAIQFDEEIHLILPFQYDYIGLTKRSKNGKIDSQAFAVLKNNEWKLVDKNNQDLISARTEQIKNYNDTSIILEMDEFMYLINYKNESIIFGPLKNVDYFDEYIAVWELNNNFYLYDTKENKVLSNPTPVYDMKAVELIKNENTIEIYIENKLAETIAI